MVTTPSSITIMHRTESITRVLANTPGRDIRTIKKTTQPPHPMTLFVVTSIAPDPASQEQFLLVKTFCFSAVLLIYLKKCNRITPPPAPLICSGTGVQFTDLFPLHGMTPKQLRLVGSKMFPPFR